MAKLRRAVPTGRPRGELWLWLSAFATVFLVITVAVGATGSADSSAEALPRQEIAAFAALILIEIGVAYGYMRLRERYRRLVRQGEIFKIVSENAADMIALVGVDGQRLYNSPAYERVLGYTLSELASSSGLDQVHPDDRLRVIEAAREAQRTGTGRRLEYRIRHKQGNWIVVESTASALRNSAGEVDKLVIVNRDITERREAEAKLQYQALHDMLTNLPNRTSFLEALERRLSRARKVPGYGFAVLVVNVDAFSALNNVVGPAGGDALILQIAAKLGDCLRPSDMIAPPSGSRSDGSDEPVLARVGADEFTILLEDVSNPSDAIRIASRAQKAIAAPLTIDGREIFPSASVGIAMSGPSGLTAEEMLRNASVAMRRAKAEGREHCSIYDERMHERAVQRLKLEADLQRAMKAEEFRVHYQPIVSLENGELEGFEALLRWQHPERGLLPPGEFIDVAEEMGLLVPIGKWLMRQSCRQLKQWQAELGQGPKLNMAVNISMKQFADPELVPYMREVLYETGMQPDALHAEITETVVMNDSANALVVLSELRDLGVRIALDDFGTGFSSLSQLCRFPADVLKIDRSFIALMGDRGNREVVRLILSLAENLKIKSVAEGIETAEQAKALHGLGCHMGQGYLYSKPVAESDARRLVMRRQPSAC